MTDYYVLDDGNPVLIVKSDYRGTKVTGVERYEDNDWQYDYAKEAMAEVEGLDLAQVTRLFGRYAGYMPTEDYSRRVAKRATDDADLRVEGEITKIDKAQQNVFGWAYVMQRADGTEVIDKSGDFLDEVEELEKTAYDYVLSSRASDADHTNVKGGTMVESIVFTPEKIEKMGLPEGSVPLGWWVGYHIEDKATWERVEKKELVMFSVHGSGTRTKVAP